MKIDGREIATHAFTKQQKDVVSLKKKGITPHLTVILVGADPASHAYVRQKKLKGERIGIKVSICEYEAMIPEDTLLHKIRTLNNDPSVHGIVIQQPLPKHINPTTLVEATKPEKDVDGFHSSSMFTPPIAEAVIEILQTVAKDQNESDFLTWLREQHIAVIGKGETGGKPIKENLKEHGMTPLVIDSKTDNKRTKMRQSTVIISCVGKKGIVTKEDISGGVILLSIGMHRGDDGKLHGDYEEDEIKDVAGYYTPVPGGVGPVNVAMLLANVLEAAKR